MTWTRKLKPHLVNNVSISNEAFNYILENRQKKDEPIYKVIDRIILEHKQFVQSHTRNVSNESL
jgi:hypothetical protein